MEPIDKVSARADALRVLGLDLNANADAIRNAWRDIAFHAHPDHASGDYAAFSHAKSAYDYLRKEGFAIKGPARSAGPSRPKLRKRVVEIASDVIDACHRVLKTEPDLPKGPDSSARGQETDSNSDHVADAFGCFGRDLTYFVPTPVCEGINRVALPTAVLTRHRPSELEVLTFQSNSAGSGEVTIPDPIRERQFPGATSVKIRFLADQVLRNEFRNAS